MRMAFNGEIVCVCVFLYEPESWSNKDFAAVIDLDMYKNCPHGNWVTKFFDDDETIANEKSLKSYSSSY